MLKPEKLNENDTIAIVSLSSGIAGDKEFNHRYNIGKERLEKVFNLKTITLTNALKGSKILNENPELRAKDLMDAFKNKNIKAIISNIGGDDTIRLLPYIDYEVIKNNPKIFIGYSDTTINHFVMYKAGLVSYYGPSVMAEMAENVKMHEYTKNHFKNILFKNSKNYQIKPSPIWTSISLSWLDSKNNNIEREMTKDEKGFEVLNGKGKFEGILIGGCIDTFHMFIGSDIWPRKDEWKNKILFLETSEDTPEPSFIAQILRNPLMQECLENIKGLLIGKPYNEKYYEEYKDVYLNVIKKEYHLENLPIIYNYNFGHTAPMCIMPIGIKVEVNCENGIIEFKESATKEEK